MTSTQSKDQNMADEKRPDQLEMEKIRLERFKVWGRIITVTVSVLIGSGLGAIINYTYQNKQLDLQAMKLLGGFIDYALENDDVKRLRFAQYFAKLTPSKSLKKNWDAYYKEIVDDQKKLKNVDVQLKKEKSKDDSEKDKDKIRELELDRNQLQSKLSAFLAEESTDYLTVKEAKRLYLDEDWKPRNYTENKFEVKTVSNDTMVVDNAIGLTWQQSGSEEYMSYDDAKRYIAQLNRDKFAGFSDWRLPTLSEAITLLEEKESSNGLFIDPIFDKRLEWIWTSDLYSASRAWVVGFGNGYCGYDYFGYGFYVRAVR